jgi:hypothetical protein
MQSVYPNRLKSPSRPGRPGRTKAYATPPRSTAASLRGSQASVSHDLYRLYTHSSADFMGGVMAAARYMKEVFHVTSL